MKKTDNLQLRLLVFFMVGFAAVVALLRAWGDGVDPQTETNGDDETPRAGAEMAEGGFFPRKILKPAEGADNVIRRLGEFVPRNHLSQKRFDAGMSAIAWTNFIASIDFDRSYFLQTDIDQFAEMRDKLGELLQSGDTSWAYGVFETYKARLADRYTFVTNQLAQAMEFADEEFYEPNRRNAAWPADEGERDDLWRRKIKNEYLGTVVAREIDAEAAPNRVARADDPPQNRFEVSRSSEIHDIFKGMKIELFKTQAILNQSRLAREAEGEAAYTLSEEDFTQLRECLEGMEKMLDEQPGEKPPAPPPPAPGELVANRYRQLKTVMNDYDADFVLQRFASAIVSAYDPHSDYMSPAKAEDFIIDMSLKLTGIGAMLRNEDGAAMVVELIPGGPAERDTREIRLRPKDKIIGVAQGDGEIEDVMHLPIDKTVRKIRGTKGTKVVLQVISGSDPSGAATRLIDLVRDEVKLEEQAATGRVERVAMPDGSERSLGVVRLPTFYRTFDQRPGSKDFRSAALDVADAVARLNNENIEGLVLDLRNNGGGALAEAVDLTALFVKSGPVVQVREPRGIQALQIQPSEIAGPMFRKPLVVLVNRTSASASEIVAGALQDYGRAIIVGDSKTHGKGTVQTVLPLGGRFGDKALGQAKLTTATFYRVSGASTQLRGITPDIVIPSTLDALEIGEEFLPNPLPWTRIDDTLHTPVFELGETVAKLQTLSAERLAKNEKYQKYSRRIEHFAKRSRDSTVPLEYAARKAFALEEREINKIQDAESGGENDGEEDPAVPRGRRGESPAEDVILREALDILSDFITLTEGREVPLSTGGNLQGGMFRLFGGF